MRGKVVALLGLGLVLAAPTAQAQGSRSEIVLRGHVRDMRDMRDDMRGWSMAWGRQKRAEAMARSRVARTEALATARIARESARAAGRVARDEARSARMFVSRERPLRMRFSRSRPI